MKGRRRGEPTAVGAVLPRVLDELGLEATRAALRAAACWEAVVGPEAARHSRPVALRAGVLEANVDSSVWSQQLALRRPEILAALRRELGPAAPSELRLRVG